MGQIELVEKLINKNNGIINVGTVNEFIQLFFYCGNYRFVSVAERTDADA